MHFRWKQGISRISLLSGLLAMSACQNSSSLALRWVLDEKSGIHETPVLSISPFVCAQHGIFEIEVSATSTEPSQVPTSILKKTYPCSPDEFGDPDGTVDGPKLEPGKYQIEIRGLRRSGRSWNYPEDSPVLQQLGPIAFTTFSTTIKEDQTIKNTDIRLNVPPPCDDGIDNDRDGVIDQLDIGCEGYPQRANTDEAHESRIALIQPYITQLGGLKQPSGPALGMSLIAVHVVPVASELDQECELSNAPPIDFLTCTDSTNSLSCRTLQWSENLPTIEYELDGGCFGLGLTGGAIENSPGQGDFFVPKTHTQWKPFRITAGNANFVEFSVDFSFEHFLEIPSWPLGWSPSIQPVPGLHLSGCTFDQENNALFEVVSYQMRLWNQQTDRTPDLAAALGSNATVNLDGWVEILCNKVSNLHSLGAFVWTDFYEVEILAIGQQRNQALAHNLQKDLQSLSSKTNSTFPASLYPHATPYQGAVLELNSLENSRTQDANEQTVCYGKEGARIPLAPIILNDVALDRVLLENGEPPPPCIDCINDDDCRHSTCVSSICVPDETGT